ncbi:MAG: aldose epimerase family protein [Cytophagales bacterium]
MSQLQVFTLRNSHGCEVAVTNLGGKIMSIITPDKLGNRADIVLGYATPRAYKNGNPYFGALIGRYANRIANGQFVLDGKLYHLPQNNNGNCLHGGPAGFHQVVWKIEQVLAQELRLSYVSANGEAGFPGELKCEVSYTLNEQNELTLKYQAVCNQPTVVNLTHHGFFNLAGAGNGNILNHRLIIRADRFCSVNDSLIPTGDLATVHDSPFDFLRERSIGERIAAPHDQLKKGNGYDHCWVLETDFTNHVKLAAEVWEPVTGRTLQVWTTEPGLQFYSGNFLDGSDVGREGKPYGFRSAFCLEAQHFPDSPNQLHFPSTVLKPRETYQQTTLYKFGVI